MRKVFLEEAYGDGGSVEYYLGADVDARIAELQKELDVRKAAVEAQFRLMEQVKTLTRSNERLRQKIDRRSR